MAAKSITYGVIVPSEKLQIPVWRACEDCRVRRRKCPHKHPVLLPLKDDGPGAVPKRLENFPLPPPPYGRRVRKPRTRKLPIKKPLQPPDPLGAGRKRKHDIYEVPTDDEEDEWEDEEEEQDRGSKESSIHDAITVQYPPITTPRPPPRQASASPPQQRSSRNSTRKRRKHMLSPEFMESAPAAIPMATVKRKRTSTGAAPVAELRAGSVSITPPPPPPPDAEDPAPKPKTTTWPLPIEQLPPPAHSTRSATRRGGGVSVIVEVASTPAPEIQDDAAAVPSNDDGLYESPPPPRRPPPVFHISPPSDSSRSASHSIPPKAPTPPETVASRVIPDPKSRWRDPKRSGRFSGPARYTPLTLHPPAGLGLKRRQEGSTGWRQMSVEL